MRTAPTRRPAWRGMGIWKWPSLGLVLFCLAIAVPYAQRAGGGFASLGIWTQAGQLGPCTARMGGTPREGALFLRLQIDPACARTLTPPAAALAGGEETVPFKGTQTTLSATLPCPEEGCTGETIELKAKTAGGETAAWALRVPADIPSQDEN